MNFYGFLFNNQKNKYSKYSRNFNRTNPGEFLERIINEKESIIEDLVKKHLRTETDNDLSPKKTNRKKKSFNKTEFLSHTKSKHSSANIYDKIDFGPLDYYSLKDIRYPYRTQQQEMQDKLNRTKITKSQNFAIKSGKVPLVITPDVAKTLLKNINKTPIGNNYNKISFDSFFHRNSVLTVNQKQINSVKNIHSNTCSFIEKHKYKSTFNITNLKENVIDKNNSIKSKDKNSSPRHSSTSVIYVDKNSETTSNSIKNKTTTTNYYKSDKTIKNIISSYIKKDTDTSSKTVKILNSNKNILKNKRKLFLLNKKLNLMKSFEKYVELYQHDKKYMETLDNNINNGINNNIDSLNHINTEPNKNINNQLVKKLLKIHKSNEIRKNFCKFGIKTLNLLANSVDSHRKKLNHDLFKIIDKANKKKKKEKQLDKVLEVILDKKMKKRKKSNAKHDYCEASEGKKLLEDRNKLRMLMQIGDIITNMTDDAAMNFTDNILEENSKKKNECYFNDINSYRSAKIEKAEQNRIKARDKMSALQNKIEYKMRIGLKERIHLNNKYNDVIGKNKLIEEMDEFKKNRFSSKNKNHNNCLLYLNFNKIFNNK